MMTTKNRSKIVSKILSPALQFWLRSQVESAEELEININGGDRQILGGYIPDVFLSSSRAVYQGLHLGQIQVQGENIRINLGQVIKGKPLRLLEPIPVKGKMLLKEADLNKSLTSPLFSTALTDFFFNLLKSEARSDCAKILNNYRVSWQEIKINFDKLILKGTLIDENTKTIPLTICSGLKLANPHTLWLHPLEIETRSDLVDINFNEFQVDLGSEVELENLSLLPGELSCCGGLTVLP
ncbi:MAG: DUF2993 domain-containing protein [Prochloraceae cyanobacterium]|nr:DUF2993 domain-containing protein [Prochloraceae cyanobacterium]